MSVAALDTSESKGMAPARRQPAVRAALALAGWFFAVGGVLLFGMSPTLAIAAMLVAMSPTLFRVDQ